MAGLSRQATDRKMLQQLQAFSDEGEAKGLFKTANSRLLHENIQAWLPEMRAALDPALVSAAHKTKVAPMLIVFETTHSLVAALAQLFRGWGTATDREVEIEALTGPIVIGPDEVEDEKKLRHWQPIFVKLFGASALPTQLQDPAVKKQLAAHTAAHEALPGTTDGQVYRAAQSNMIALRATGRGYWKRMHDLLDGEYGSGEGAFNLKAPFGYDRRLYEGGASRKKRVGEKPPETGGGSGEGNASEAKKEPAEEAAKE